MTPYETCPPPVVAKIVSAACESVRPGEASDAVGGVIPAFVASPASTAEASALLHAAAGLGLAVVPRGSGSRLGWGTPPSRCDLVIDMLGMGQVIEHASGDLVARVQAGARMGDVAGVLAAAGQEIALDVPADATVGGVIADALAGPRRLRYGSPRDLLIGITMVRADGTVAHSGGKVVKNVAGYDLGKLFAGSAGTLGLITEATFRLHPLPAARAWVNAWFAHADAAAAAAVAAAANSPLVASAVELFRREPGSPVNVSVLLEGSADGVGARAERMRSRLHDVGGPAILGTRMKLYPRDPDSGAERIERANHVSGAAPPWWGLPPAAGGTLLRVTFWVSALGHVLDAIDQAARETPAAVSVRGSAGAGVLYVTAAASDGDAPHEPEAVARLVTAIRAAIPAGRGSAVVLAAPEAVRAALGPSGMHGEVPGRALMRAVKDQFDPDGRMSPGRLFP